MQRLHRDNEGVGVESPLAVPLPGVIVIAEVPAGGHSAADAGRVELVVVFNRQDRRAELAIQKSA